MEIRYSHYCITVTDLEKSKDFYQLLNFSEERRFYREELKTNILYMVNPEGLKLEIIHPDAPKRIEGTAKVPLKRPFEENLSYVGYQHAGFTTTDIEDAYSSLKKGGVEIAGEIKTGKISRYFFCWDPDGNLIEIIQYFV